MDKRDLTDLFRQRLGELIAADAGSNLARFARRAGLDRSALSQFLNPGQTRLPRAETLHRIAESCGVSLDWLLGLSQSTATVTEMAPTVEIERAEDEHGRTPLERWYREASGYKIRYVPSSLPELLRHEDLIAHDQARLGFDATEARSRHQLGQLRLSQTDIECCMPVQVLDNIAAGADVWSEVPPEIRAAQLRHIRDFLQETYPRFRLFLYDEQEVFSAPYTIFGPLRAAIYLGGSYLVVNSVDQIQALIRHFDGLIRHAAIGPERASAHAARLLARDKPPGPAGC